MSLLLFIVEGFFYVGQRNILARVFGALYGVVIDWGGFLVFLDVGDRYRVFYNLEVLGELILFEYPLCYWLTCDLVVLRSY